MIDIYTEKKDLNNWILQNDLYFNLNTGNEEMSQKEIDLIRKLNLAPEEITYIISQEGRQTNSTLFRNEYVSESKDSMDIEVKLPGQYKIIESKINFSMNAMESYSYNNVSEIKDESSSEIKTSFTRTYRKQELL